MKWFLGIAAVLFCAIQTIRPSHDQPNTDPQRDLQVASGVPQNVKSILARACYNCHSNRTAWPWYSRVAPVSWLLDRDVQRGRSKLNFSEWTEESNSRRDKAEKKVQSRQICADLELGKMPPRSYRMMHSEARLSQSDVRTICRWANETAGKPMP